MPNAAGDASAACTPEQVDLRRAAVHLRGTSFATIAVSLPAHVDEFQYVPWLVANLFLRDGGAPGSSLAAAFPSGWDNVLYESPSLGYVVATHQTGRDYGPTVLTLLSRLCRWPAAGRPAKLLNMDWADLAAFVISRPGNGASRPRAIG